MRAGLATIFVWVASVLVGCARFPEASLRARPGPRQGELHVYLLRGFCDWYSDGMESLTRELRDRQIDATSVAERQWQTLDAALAEGSLPDRHLVLIGFSYGADDAVAIARRRWRRGRAVDLLITIDPVTPAGVPPNVRRCVNFFQSNGLWDLLPWLRGVPLHREATDGLPLANINLRRHPELLEPHTSHATIAGNPRVHAAIIGLVLSAAHS